MPVLSSNWLVSLPAASCCFLLLPVACCFHLLGVKRFGSSGTCTRTGLMAKRRAGDFVLLQSPYKKLCRSLHLVDAQQASASPAGGVNSPSPLLLPASRPRKRSFYFEDLDEQTEQEATVGRKITRASPILMERTSGCPSDRCSANSAPACSETWPRGDRTRLATISPKIRDEVSH